MDVVAILSLIVAAAIIGVILVRSRTHRPAPSPGALPLADGRLMHVSADQDAVIDALEEVLGTYRERAHPGVPQLAPAGFTWSCLTDEKPDAVYLCADADRSPLVITLRPVADGTEIGMIPLSRRPDRLLVSMMGHLHARMPVTSIGAVPSGCVTLVAPRVAPSLVEDTLTYAGYPVTAKNLELVAEQAVANTLTRASEFIAQSGGERAAEAWIAEWNARDHEWASAVDRVESILRELAAWDSTLLTQIQDVPRRVQFTIVDAIRERTPGSGWDELER